MRRRQCVCAWMILVIFVLGWAGVAAAQNTASLSGTVVDPSGRAVAGAKLSLASSTTGAARSAVSDDTGRYSFLSLSPGTYKLAVDGGANFGLFTNDTVTVRVGENATFDLRLELRGVQQSVPTQSILAALTVCRSTAATTSTSRSSIRKRLETSRRRSVPHRIAASMSAAPVLVRMA